VREVIVRPLGAGARPTILHVGSWRASVDCAVDEEEGRIAICAETMAQVGLNEGDRCWLLALEEHLYLGPVVAVLLSAKTLSTLHQGGGPERYQRMAREACAAGALLILCDASGLDLEQNRVTGWVMRHQRWQEARLPLPDVIYHRATYAQLPERKRVKQVLHELSRVRGVCLINSVSSFGKVQVHDALSFFRETEALNPETCSLTDCNQLDAMLARHAVCFLKAEHGSHGNEVARISRQEERWEVRGRLGGAPVLEQFADRDQLCDFLLMVAGNSAWVLQQGIELPEVDGQVFDLRAILQKDGHGSWKVPLVMARLAQKGEVAANMSRGGLPFLPADFLQQHGKRFPYLSEMEATASEVARRVALALESRYGRLGEVGVDLGFDGEGRPWVFEANAKPLHPQIEGMPIPLERLPFRYAVLLAQRSWRGRHCGLSTPVAEL
jgi:hypothetical protein